MTIDDIDVTKLMRMGIETRTLQGSYNELERELRAAQGNLATKKKNLSQLKEAGRTQNAPLISSPPGKKYESTIGPMIDFDKRIKDAESSIRMWQLRCDEFKSELSRLGDSNERKRLLLRNICDALSSENIDVEFLKEFA